VRAKLIVPVDVIEASCLAVVFVCVNRLGLRSLRAHWSTTGEAPWGTAERDENGGVPVVLWLPVPGGYCYDAVFSTDLRERLGASHAAIVVVDCNVFSDFGRPRRHTVKAVSGIPVDDRSRQDSGMMETPRDGRSKGIPTDCDSFLANSR
jgi:hypothetical protein